MPLQDLTPELRTRLSRVERVVGWFVSIATIVLLAGFGYYIYKTAQDRGWFVTKVNYATTLNDASGFKVGDPVKLMGFSIGQVTKVELNDANARQGVTIFFNVRDPYYGYVWYDSHVKIVSDFLNNRYLEMERGRTGQPTVFTDSSKQLLAMVRLKAWYRYQELGTNGEIPFTGTNGQPDEPMRIKMTNQLMAEIKAKHDLFYTNVSSGGYDKPLNLAIHNYIYIPALDMPSMGDRLNGVADQVEKALPSFLALTNELSAVLSNANNAVVKLDGLLAHSDPIMTNLAVLTGNLKDTNGALGKWVLPPELLSSLHDTLKSAHETLDAAHVTLDHTDTNVTMLAMDLDKTLEHLADITSNLDMQVQTNTNLVSNIDTIIVHTDDLIQGLKRHWLLRSAFKAKPVKKDKSTNAPPVINKSPHER